MSILNATVDDRNGSSCSRDTSPVQLLYTGDAIDRVIRRGSIVTKRLALESVRGPDARRLVEPRRHRRYGRLAPP